MKTRLTLLECPDRAEALLLFEYIKIFENRNSPQCPRGHRRFVTLSNHKSCSDLPEHYNGVCLVLITLILKKLWPKIKHVPGPTRPRPTIMEEQRSFAHGHNFLSMTAMKTRLTLLECPVRAEALLLFECIKYSKIGTRPSAHAVVDDLWYTQITKVGQR